MVKRTTEEIHEIAKKRHDAVRKEEKEQRRLHELKIIEDKYHKYCASVGVCPKCGEIMEEFEDEDWNDGVQCKPCDFTYILKYWITHDEHD